jgi:hypothetical protein
MGQPRWRGELQEAIMAAKNSSITAMLPHLTVLFMVLHLSSSKHESHKFIENPDFLQK